MKEIFTMEEALQVQGMDGALCSGEEQLAIMEEKVSDALTCIRCQPSTIESDTAYAQLPELVHVRHHASAID